MRFVALLLLIALGQAAPPQDSAWPPPGVLTARDGATKPTILRRVEPAYTREAVRAQIQGFVTLQFVVEPSGTVGPIRVLRSLDRVHGLDDAAVGALSKWLFKPGTKDGVPVRVATVALLMFSISGVPPPMTLPAGFEAATDPASTKWIDETVETEGVVIKFAYPEGWHRGDSNTVVILVNDPDSMALVGVVRPMRLPGPLPFPMPISQLAQFSETMRMQQNRAGQEPNGLAVGQSPLGTKDWLWLELEASTANMPFSTPEVDVMMRDAVDGVHIWAFSTGAGSQLVQVMCMLPGNKNASPAAREATLARTQTQCAEILKRMSITAR